MPNLTPGERFDKRLREIVQSTQSPVPEAQRLEKLLREFREIYPRPSFLGRLADWFAHPHRVPAPAIAFAVVLVAVQGVILLGPLLTPPAEDLYRGITVKCDDCETIRITFKPDAKYSEVMDLLHDAHTTLNKGPSELREIWVTVPKGCPFERALDLFKNSTLIEQPVVANEPTNRICTKK